MDSDVHLSKKANFVQIQFNFQYNRNERVKTGGGLPELKESDEEEELLLAEPLHFPSSCLQRVTPFGIQKLMGSKLESCCHS